jgi:hypothetical protein
MEHKSTPFPQSKKLKKADGTIAYIWDNKLHNWSGPALIPEGNEKKSEYYLYGIQKTKEEWTEAIRQQSGLPWYKQASPKGTTNRN